MIRIPDFTYGSLSTTISHLSTEPGTEPGVSQEYVISTAGYIAAPYKNNNLFMSISNPSSVLSFSCRLLNTLHLMQVCLNFFNHASPSKFASFIKIFPLTLMVDPLVSYYSSTFMRFFIWETLENTPIKKPYHITITIDFETWDL